MYLIVTKGNKWPSVQPLSMSSRGWKIPFPNPLFLFMFVIFAPIFLTLFLVKRQKSVKEVLKRIGVAYFVFVRKVWGWAVIVNIVIVAPAFVTLALLGHIFGGNGNFFTYSFLIELLAIVVLVIVSVVVSRWIVLNRKKIVGPSLVYDGE